MRGVPIYLYMRKCRWLDKDTGSAFTYDIDYDEEDGTQLSSDLFA